MALEPAIGVIEGRCQRSRAAGWIACAVAVSSAACGRYWVCDEVDEEFTRDGVRVETRLLEKLGPDEGWVALAYLRNQRERSIP
jgi:hypothetical protein